MLTTTDHVTTSVPYPSLPARDAFMILGMHRSGTSAVSGTLARLGATPPKTLMQENSGNERGYWESAVLMAFHDRLLASCGSRWDDWRMISEDWYETPVAAALKAEAKQLLAAEFGASPSFVLKDPRICRFARFWLEIFDEEKIRARLILPIRPPLEVAKSLHTRDGSPISEGLLLWLRHVLDAERATRNRPRSFLRWADFLDDWREVTHQIAVAQNFAWPALSDLTATEVDLFLSHALKHEHADSSESQSHPSMHPWVLAAHQGMLRLVTDPQDPAALIALDEIRISFDRAAEAFGPIISLAEAKHAAVNQLLASERNANAEYAAHHQHIENVRAADTERLIAEREATLNAQLSAAYADHAAAVAELHQQRQALDAQLASQGDLLESLRKAVEASDAQDRVGQDIRADQENQIEELSRERAALVMQLEETKATAAAAQERHLLEEDLHERDMAKVSTTLTAVLQSRSWAITRPARAVLGWFR